jgi:hypothetical protein
MCSFGHALLRQGKRLAQVAQRHFLFDDPTRLRLDFALLIDRKPGDQVVQCPRHVHSPFFCCAR